MDVITFDKATDSKELLDDLRIGASASKPTHTRVIILVQNYWDSFAKKGCKRPIIGFEFSIDTGTAKPVCCRKPTYGFYENDIIMKQIAELLKNGWIRLCQGPWGSIIVLAAKPHQEKCTHINDFIWRMCVSYRKLNAVTKPFQFPIPRCDVSITIIGNGAKTLYLIALDNRQGYHQVSVRTEDQEKLAFFAPDGNKYCFTVLPFGPCNAPSFYTAMMKVFQDEWDSLFQESLQDISKTPSSNLVFTKTGQIAINGDIFRFGSNVIIDDILLWGSDLDLMFVYLECVFRVSKKYRSNFKLNKCEFFSDRVEFVGHDILSAGNSPASSKFKSISDWELPQTGQMLFSFIGLITHYAKFLPYHEMRIKPLRRLLKQYFRTKIPLMSWTPSLIELFHDIKLSVTSSPLLSRFDASKPTFLKTDWSSKGMGFILMQPANDDESTNAIKELHANGTCLFDLTPDGPRLLPVQFGSRSCTTIESKLHSFLGEVATVRWAIGHLKRYLWGNHFWLLCDCISVKAILEYTGSITVVMQWAQELLAYNFTVVHRDKKNDERRR